MVDDQRNLSGPDNTYFSEHGIVTPYSRGESLLTIAPDNSVSIAQSSGMNHRIKSSALIREADAIADFAWPGERHYTYVNAQKIRSVNPGYCFKKAGWRQCGETRGGLVILERISYENTVIFSNIDAKTISTKPG